MARNHRWHGVGNRAGTAGGMVKEGKVNEEQGQILYQATKFASIYVNLQFETPSKLGDLLNESTQHIVALVHVAKALEKEIERYKNEMEVLRRAAERNPLMDFFAEQQKEANKPQQGPWTGDGSGIIGRK